MIITKVTKIEEIKVNDIIRWKNGFGDYETGKVIEVKLGAMRIKKVKIFNTLVSVNYMLRLHQSLEVIAE
jgi:hypothetical protein